MNFATNTVHIHPAPLRHGIHRGEDDLYTGDANRKAESASLTKLAKGANTCACTHEPRDQ